MGAFGSMPCTSAAHAANSCIDGSAIILGKIADLVFVRGDPLEDVANAANVEMVMKNGVATTLEEILRPLAVGGAA